MIEMTDRGKVVIEVGTMPSDPIISSRQNRQSTP